MNVVFRSGISILDFVVSNSIEENARGIPTGSPIEIFAPEKRGKSVLAGVYARNLQKYYENGNVIYIDTEGESLHSDFLYTTLQMDKSRFHKIATVDRKKVKKELEKLLFKKGLMNTPLLIIWDSITELRDIADLEKHPEKLFDDSSSAIASDIRANMQVVDNLFALSTTKPFTQLLISQVRENFSANTFIHQKEYKKLYAPGGRQKRHIIHYQFFIGSYSPNYTDKILLGKVAEMKRAGFFGKIVVLKNRFWGAWEEFEIPFFFNFSTGTYDNFFTTMNIFNSYLSAFSHIISKSGSRKWLIGVNGVEVGSYADLITYLKQNPKVFYEIEKEMLKTMSKYNQTTESFEQLRNEEELIKDLIGK